MKKKEYDVVNNPSHYCEGRKYEPANVIYDWGLDFFLGNTVKYISRAGKKDDLLQDLKKAKWYLDKKIEKLENPDAEDEIITVLECLETSLSSTTERNAINYVLDHLRSN